MPDAELKLLYTAISEFDLASVRNLHNANGIKPVLREVKPSWSFTNSAGLFLKVMVEEKDFPQARTLMDGFQCVLVGIREIAQRNRPHP